MKDYEIEELYERYGDALNDITDDERHELVEYILPYVPENIVNKYLCYINDGEYDLAIAYMEGVIDGQEHKSNIIDYINSLLLIF